MLLIITKLLIQGSGQDGDGEGGPAQDHLQRNGQGVHGLRAGTVQSCVQPCIIYSARTGLLYVKSRYIGPLIPILFSYFRPFLLASYLG